MQVLIKLSRELKLDIVDTLIVAYPGGLLYNEYKEGSRSIILYYEGWDFDVKIQVYEDD